MKLNLDCRYFIGEKPCKYNRLCDGCSHYSPFGTKILIIKLGAMGDVVRTTPLIDVIQRRFPAYHLTWLVDDKSRIFLDGNPSVHRVISYGIESVLRLRVEEFDIVFSLDKEVRAASIAQMVKAEHKFGVGFNPVGNIYPFNPEAEYSFSLGMCDQIKFFQNEKTYQREILDTLGFSDERYGMYSLPWDSFNLDYGYKFLERHGMAGKKWVIGLNTGAGEVFATKRYRRDHFVALIKMIAQSFDATILLLGGPNERERNQDIMDACAGIDQLLNTGCDNPLENFMGIINCCDIIVTGDTLALHLALALKKRVVGLFGSTCAQEIDMYGLGDKIVSLPECAPCYKKSCPWKGDRHMMCMKQIKPQRVMDSILVQASVLEGE